MARRVRAHLDLDFSENLEFEDKQSERCDQLQKFDEFLISKNRQGILRNIIDIKTLHFEDLAHPYAKDFLPQALFLGDGDDGRWSLWAWVKPLKNSVPIVDVIVRYRDAEGNALRAETIEDRKTLVQYRMMYPFCVLSDETAKMPRARRIALFKLFIKYIYMETGFANDLFYTPPDKTFERLLSAMAAVDRIYGEMGGVKNVPKVYSPRLNGGGGVPDVVDEDTKEKTGIQVFGVAPRRTRRRSSVIAVREMQLIDDAALEGDADTRKALGAMRMKRKQSGDDEKIHTLLAKKKRRSKLVQAQLLAEENMEKAQKKMDACSETLEALGGQLADLDKKLMDGIKELSEEERLKMFLS